LLRLFWSLRHLKFSLYFLASKLQAYLLLKLQSGEAVLVLHFLGSEAYDLEMFLLSGQILKAMTF